MHIAKHLAAVVKKGSPAAAANEMTRLLQLRVLQLRLLKDGNVGTSLRQTHPTQQFRVARVGADAVELGTSLYDD